MFSLVELLININKTHKSVSSKYT